MNSIAKASSDVPNNVPTPRPGPVYAIFFLSGATGLIYEMLWMRQLSWLFGNSAYAVSATLAALFLGLALGGPAGARLLKKWPHPLNLYGRLEIAIACCALPVLLLQPLYQSLMATWFSTMLAWPALGWLLKLVLAMVVITPAAACMGATLPVLGHWLVNQAEDFSRRGTLLYSLNTLGAVSGVISAGFFLPLWLGIGTSYLFTMTASVTLGVVALVLSRRLPGGTPYLSRSEKTPAADKPAGAFTVVVFLSGFLIMGLEVLWTMMFEQVLQNSVYSFSLILACFLLALALGGLLANRLCRRDKHGEQTLVTLMTTGALLLCLSPWLFQWLTDGLHYYGGEAAFISYLGKIFLLALVTVMVPAILLGAVFPFMFRLYQQDPRRPADVYGKLLFVNTMGAVAGSLFAGFVLVPLAGFWNGVYLFAFVYIAAAMVLRPNSGIQGASPGDRLSNTAAVAGLVLAVSGIASAGTTVYLSTNKKERLVDSWQGRSGVVAVVQRPGTRLIKVNNHYTLGGSGARFYETRQTRLPLYVHGNAKRIFYLGLGTGITAGAALNPGTEKVVICEIVPEVITAVRLYFQPWINGLFEDARVRVHGMDGRHYLAATDERFDLIIADLFIPWRAGVGSVYSLEHYQNARQRLDRDGLYVQWLPLFQMSAREFFTVAKTMHRAFPRVTVWRGDFFSSQPIVALIGHNRTAPMNMMQTATYVRRLDTRANADTHLLYYAGNLDQADELLQPYAVNTDDFPVIEFTAPVSHRRFESGALQWFTGEILMAFFEKLVEQKPDAYLSTLTAQQKKIVRAGLWLHRARVKKDGHDDELHQKYIKEFIALTGANPAAIGAIR